MSKEIKLKVYKYVDTKVFVYLSIDIESLKNYPINDIHQDMQDFMKYIEDKYVEKNTKTSFLTWLKNNLNV